MSLVRPCRWARFGLPASGNIIHLSRGPRKGSLGLVGPRIWNFASWHERDLSRCSLFRRPVRDPAPLILFLRRHACPTDYPNPEHHRRGHALALARLKGGLDQRFFLMLKVEDAGVDLSRAAVCSAADSALAGAGRRSTCSCRRATTCSALTQARNATGSLGQPMSSFPPCTCNDGVASFDTASVAISLRSHLAIC